MLEKIYHPEKSPLKTMVNNIKHFFVETKLPKKMWLISCSHNPHLQFIDKPLPT